MYEILNFKHELKIFIQNRFEKSNYHELSVEQKTIKKNLLEKLKHFDMASSQPFKLEYNIEKLTKDINKLIYNNAYTKDFSGIFTVNGVQTTEKPHSLDIFPYLLKIKMLKIPLDAEFLRINTYSFTDNQTEMNEYLDKYNLLIHAFDTTTEEREKLFHQYVNDYKKFSQYSNKRSKTPDLIDNYLIQLEKKQLEYHLSAENKKATRLKV